MAEQSLRKGKVVGSSPTIGSRRCGVNAAEIVGLSARVTPVVCNSYHLIMEDQKERLKELEESTRRLGGWL